MGAGRARWGALHLAGEVASGEHARTLAEAVRDLVGVHPLHGDADPETRTSHVVFDEDKLALLSLGDVREQVVSAATSVATGRNDTSTRMRRHVRHRSAMGTSRITLVGVASKDVGLSHVIVGTMAGVRRVPLVSLVMILVGVVFYYDRDFSQQPVVKRVKEYVVFVTRSWARILTKCKCNTEAGVSEGF